jgi:hypothetical protein
VTSIAIITAVTGDYDHEIQHDALDHRSDIHRYFFTDGQSSRRGWRRVELPANAGLDNRRLSKLPKLNPHAYDFLREYEYVIWIDGDMGVLNSKFPEQIISYLSYGLLLSPHFDNRHCAYGEATIRPPKYANEPLDKQVAFYRSEGFPENFGLFEAGVQVRRMNSHGLIEFERLWLEQNMTFSYQDQISLPYSLWKTGLQYSALPKSFREYEWIHINAHKRED